MNATIDTNQPTLLARGGLESIEATGRLPSPSGVALEVMRLCRSEETSLAKLARVVQSDPALSARLIRAANAPALARSRPTLAIRDALMVLGMPVVRQFALGFSLISGNKSGSCEGFDYGHFWSRSLLAALAAQTVGARVRVMATEELFTCGLLADIGRLALASLFPKEYSALLLGARGRSGADVAALERERFATDHDELTLALLGKWGFPKTLVMAIEARRDPGRLGDGGSGRVRQIADSLRLAERVADACLADEDARRSQLAPLLLDAARLGLDADALTAISKEVLAEWSEWGSILKLPGQHKVSELTFDERMGAGSGEFDAAAATDADVPLALLVDDDDAHRNLLATLVGRCGFRVRIARNGSEALEQAMHLRPRLVITGWGMPEMDAVDLVRALRETRFGRGIYAIVFTALEDEDHLGKIFSAGADDYFTQPLVPRVIEARLRAARRIVGQQEELGRDVDEIRRFASELAVNNRKLQKAVMTDPLTGLPNRRHAIERIEQEWSAARRRKGPLACIVVDVDHFKRVNDTYGHDAGDTVLCNIAQRLRSATRLQDAVCRIGGEEFLVICPETTEADALAHAERLRVLVAELHQAGLPREAHPTISLGVASMIPDGGSSAELLKNADRAVYLAKAQGRNRSARLPVESSGQV
jgi:diguanylate cyclase (GGDEF)-like protein